MKKVFRDTYIVLTLLKTDAHFSEAYDTDRSDKIGTGKFNFHIDVTALKEVVYMPISIATGRKSTGFIYQIEGTGEGNGVGSVNGRGEAVTTVTFGSITYFKILPSRTVSCKIFIEVTAPLKREYKVIIGRVNYKLNTSDARYKRFLVDIGSKTLKFR